MIPQIQKITDHRITYCTDWRSLLRGNLLRIILNGFSAELQHVEGTPSRGQYQLVDGNHFVFSKPDRAAWVNMTGILTADEQNN